MKLVSVILHSLLLKLIICISYTDSEYLSFMEKECETSTIQNFSLCEKYRKIKLSMRVKTTVYAESDNLERQEKNKNDILDLKMPVNTCKSEDCQYCCLSTNKCGTKKQCENSKYYIRYVNGIFISLILILTTFLIIKCYTVDSLPEQTTEDKIDKNDMDNLVDLYIRIRGKKVKSES